MFLVWNFEDLKGNYIEDVQMVSYYAGGDITYAKCLILRHVTKDGCIDTSDIGVAFLNLYGRYEQGSAGYDWHDSIPDFIHFFYLLSSGEVKNILRTYGISYTDPMDVFGFDAETAHKARRSLASIESLYKMKEQTKDSFTTLENLE